ncbi:MAG: thioredoxin-like negative regulator of GroEL [Halobacteriales archaeon]|jgi:thioredoxin-like negative regulator of GroEL
MNTRKLLLVGGIILVVAVLGVGTSLSMLSHGTYSEHGGIDWHSDLETAIETAGDEESPVLVYFWLEDCGSCSDFEAMLEESGPPDAMDRYVLAAVRADETPETMDRYDVPSTPRLVVLTPDGEKVASFNPLAVDDLDARLERAYDEAISTTEQ